MEALRRHMYAMDMVERSVDARANAACKASREARAEYYEFAKVSDHEVRSLGVSFAGIYASHRALLDRHLESLHEHAGAEASAVYDRN